MSEPKKVKLTKKIVDQAEPGDSRYCIWDSELKGFGLQVERRRTDGTDATKSYMLRYRLPGAGRAGEKGFLRLGRHGQITADQAREQAKIALGQVAAGRDPALERAQARETEATKQIKSMTVEDLGKLFLSEAITARRKPGTAVLYEGLCDCISTRASASDPPLNSRASKSLRIMPRRKSSSPPQTAW